MKIQFFIVFQKLSPIYSKHNFWCGAYEILAARRQVKFSPYLFYSFKPCMLNFRFGKNRTVIDEIWAL